MEINCNEPPSLASATGSHVGMQSRESYQLLFVRITCTFEYAAPMKEVSTTMYWQMTHIWWLLCKNYSTWYLAGGSLRLICIKPILSYISFSKLSCKILDLKGRNNPQILHSCKLCSTGRNSTKLEQQKTTTPQSEWLWAPILGVSRQILIIQKQWWDSFVHSMSRDSNCP
jgi:hypothetical protein